MSSKQSSSTLSPPPPLQQPQTQLPKPIAGTARLPSVSTRPPRISVTSTSNVFRSLSTIHRSTSVLPASLLDLDVASTAGLQVIRPETHPEAFVPVPPDGGWGWVVVFAAFVTNLVIDGICVSFGIMATDLVDHFNAPVATVMLTGSLLLGVYQIVGPVAAGLVNKFGCRAVGVAGSLLATVSMFASAFMPTIELMLISYGVIAGAAFGFLHLPSIICVSFYFDSRRALAIGITSCGTPLGAMVFAPLTEVLLKKYGWANTLILFAGMLLNCTVMAALYRPLTPALVLTPMKSKEADAIKSLLQLAAQPPEGLDAGDRVGGTTPVTSQRDLRDQPVMEEPEGEAETASEAKSDSETESDNEKQPQQQPPQPTQLSPISESPEKEVDFSGRSTSSVRLRGKQRRTYQSESRSSRAYLKPIPRQSVVHLAQASVPRRRAESVAMGVLAQSHLSALGSQLFTSAAGGIENIGGRGMVSTLELAEGAPVIVELPHESITVEDYARPLYRKDIFFPGSVKRQIDASAASIATAAANVLDPSNEQVGNSQASMAIQDELRRRKVCVSGTSQFGSSILFGDNVPLPPINESSVPEEGVPGDANWTGSCLMSLTKIPLPDVFENKEATSGTDSEAYLWDRLRAETGLNLSDTPADGIYRVPRSHSLCGWWLCWKTQRTHSLDRGDMDSVERLKRALMEDGDRAADKKFSRRAHLVLRRKCDFLPKSMCDVLVTMMNLSLLKSKSFLLFCLASLIAMTGAYVPLFFVCDLADSFNIPKSQSAYLLTVYGGASVLSRFSSSWAAGKPNVSATMVSTVTLFLAGCAVCIMPYWSSLIGQIILMAAFGLAISPFFSLTSIILCDILDLEALTNAYGIVTLVRGIASTVGSPVAGTIVSATSTFSIAFLLSGATVLIGGFLYIAIILHERAKLNKLIADADSDHDKI